MIWFLIGNPTRTSSGRIHFLESWTIFLKTKIIIFYGEIHNSPAYAVFIKKITIKFWKNMWLTHKYPGPIDRGFGISKYILLRLPNLSQQCNNYYHFYYQFFPTGGTPSSAKLPHALLCKKIKMWHLNNVQNNETQVVIPPR